MRPGAKAPLIRRQRKRVRAPTVKVPQSKRETGIEPATFSLAIRSGDKSGYKRLPLITEIPCGMQVSRDAL
jgi:hypothetical protein